jgi:tRNA threonylcarbamoyl adenosine modification protein (Sua5/YciO/YrdC/YwlC family)
MLIKMYEDNPSQRIILQVVEVLRNGGLVIFPTDTLYGLGCDINHHRAIEKIARLKNLDFNTAKFSFICYDLSSLSEYCKQVDTPVYKIMKKNLPGPFTFILQASGKVPKILKNKKKTIGIRVPNNNIIREIVKELGNPILTTSIHNDEDDILEYITDPELIHEKYEDSVDIVIDGGYGKIVGSSIINCTGPEIEIIREGEKELEF